MFDRLQRHWVYGGALAGALLLILAPLLVGSWPAALALTFLHLPVYMLHQLEEHDDDRFRRFFNETLGHGQEVLSPAAVFVVNVPGVWGVIAASLWLALQVAPGFALIAVYLMLVNAVVHAAHAAIFRRYNPGLASALLAFLPLSGAALVALQRTGAGTPGYHVLGLGIGVGIHGAIVLATRPRR